MTLIRCTVFLNVLYTNCFDLITFLSFVILFWFVFVLKFPHPSTVSSSENKSFSLTRSISILQNTIWRHIIFTIIWSLSHRKRKFICFSWHCCWWWCKTTSRAYLVYWKYNIKDVCSKQNTQNHYIGHKMHKLRWVWCF